MFLGKVKIAKRDCQFRAFERQKCFQNCVIFINAENKKNLHSQCEKIKKIAFPIQKIKEICIPTLKRKTY
jgi:hypothetical protein